MHAQLHYSAPEQVQAVIEQLGRTEDVMFSPSNRRLAVAGFRANKIAVFDIDLSWKSGVCQIAIPRVIEVHAPFLAEPHGICFLDERTLAVANRSGHVHIMDAPFPETPHDQRSTIDRKCIKGGPESLVRTPGSVAAIVLDGGSVELAVCNNSANYVTRHIIRNSTDLDLRCEDVLLETGLDIPDGICYSPDAEWLAVSNHNTHNVFVYRRTPSLNRSSLPDAVLRNVLCPHGIRFTPDGTFILVADASARYVNVYKRMGPGWAGLYDPYALFPVVDRPVFTRGRLNPQEGGPKGIDIDKNMTLLVTTCEFQALAFFDLKQVLSRQASPENRHKRYIRWRLENALHRRRPDVYRWLHSSPERMQYSNTN
jgi:sugar lactone lactonase YvrE